MSGAELNRALQDEMNHAQDMLAKLSSLNANGDVTNRQLDVSVRAVCLTVHVAFETFIRELFFQCVTGVSEITIVKSRLQRLEVAAASDIVLAGRQFVDWLPVTSTMARAEIYLAMGQPFIRLWRRNLILEQLDRLQVVRNRIAHSGEQANVQYTKKISRGQADFEEPARWLMNVSGGSTRSNIELIIDAISSTSAALVAQERTPLTLGPASASSNVKKVVAGKYKCITCGRTSYVSVGGSLPNCINCSTRNVCMSCGRVTQPESSWKLVQIKA